MTNPIDLWMVEGGDKVRLRDGFRVPIPGNGNGGEWSGPESVGQRVLAVDDEQTLYLVSSNAQYGGAAGTGDGILHRLTSPGNPGPSAVAHDVSKSTNGGASWGSNTRLQNDASQDVPLRRVQIAVDGNLVCVVGSDDSGDSHFWRSTDAGDTWGGYTKFEGFRSQAVAIDPVTGTVHSVGIMSDDFAYHTRSTDGGASWSSPAKIGGATLPPGGQPEQARGRIGAHDGNVVAAWEGSRNDGVRPIQGVRSSDDGATWGDLETFVDGYDTNHHDLWMVGTVVHLVFARDESTADETPVGYVFSLNSGATWSDVETALDDPTTPGLPWNVRATASEVWVTDAANQRATRPAPGA